MLVLAESVSQSVVMASLCTFYVILVTGFSVSSRRINDYSFDFDFNQTLTVPAQQTETVSAQAQMFTTPQTTTKVTTIQVSFSSESNIATMPTAEVISPTPATRAQATSLTPPLVTPPTAFIMTNTAMDHLYSSFPATLNQQTSPRSSTTPDIAANQVISTISTTEPLTQTSSTNIATDEGISLDSSAAATYENSPTPPITAYEPTTQFLSSKLTASVTQEISEIPRTLSTIPTLKGVDTVLEPLVSLGEAIVEEWRTENWTTKGIQTRSEYSFQHYVEFKHPGENHTVVVADVYFSLPPPPLPPPFNNRVHHSKLRVNDPEIHDVYHQPPSPRQRPRPRPRPPPRNSPLKSIIRVEDPETHGAWNISNVVDVYHTPPPPRPPPPLPPLRNRTIKFNVRMENPAIHGTWNISNVADVYQPPPPPRPPPPLPPLGNRSLKCNVRMEDPETHGACGIGNVADMFHPPPPPRPPPPLPPMRNRPIKFNIGVEDPEIHGVWTISSVADVYHPPPPPRPPPPLPPRSINRPLKSNFRIKDSDSNDSRNIVFVAEVLHPPPPPPPLPPLSNHTLQLNRRVKVPEAQSLGSGNIVVIADM